MLVYTPIYLLVYLDLGHFTAAQGDPEPQRLPEVPIGLGRRGWYGEGRFHEAVKGRLVDLVGTPGH